MTNMNQIFPHPCTVKEELDRLELIERVPELLPQATGCAGLDLILTLPRHPAVIAYVRECAAISWPDTDLKTARRNLRSATADYEKRVSFRLCNTMSDKEATDYYFESVTFCSLSKIIEARAEAIHWRKVVNEFEYRARIKEQNRQSIVRHRLHSIGLAS